MKQSNRLLQVTAFGLLLLLSFLPAEAKDKVTIYPMPSGEEVSSDYRVAVDGEAVPVYVAKVAPRDKQKLWDSCDKQQTGKGYYEVASFAYFDLNEGEAQVTVTVPDEIRSAKILPTSYGIKPTIQGNALTFAVSSPQNLTVEVNGEWIRSLHLFVNGPDENRPDPDDPDVVYFGPGIHEVTHLDIGDNKTVYVAGGSIVKLVVGDDEPYTVSKGRRNYSQSFTLAGSNITFRGRGILDASECPVHARNMIGVRDGENIRLEGIILRDASVWTMRIDHSRHVTVDNLKLIGRRPNSDGIDICSSHYVTVKNCFIRTSDDLVVLKTPRNMKDMAHIRVEKCVLWNQFAHALSLGAELTQPVDDVLFTDCDVIHDTGREWALRVYQTDKGLITNVCFDNIRVEECNRFLSVWIGKNVWTTDPEPGRIEGITFRNITGYGKDPKVELTGFDETHRVSNITFDNILVNGQPLQREMVKTNEFVDNVIVKP